MTAVPAEAVLLLMLGAMVFLRATGAWLQTVISDTDGDADGDPSIRR